MNHIKEIDEWVILILAAGSSSRMGQSKQLLLVDNKPLLRKTAEVAIASKLGTTLIMLGSQAEEHKKVVLSLPVEIIIHTDWQKGMGSTLKAGVKYILEKFPQTKGVLVLVCDQPYLTPDHLISLSQKYFSTRKPIIASLYANTLGVPCLFAADFLTHLLNLNDDEGAKKLIQLFSNKVESVDFVKGEIDLDTPGDFTKLTL